MAIKDYKSQAPAVQPPTKKGTYTAHTSIGTLRKVTISFVAGFLLGVLAMGILYIKYLEGVDNNIEQTEQDPPNTTDDQEQVETQQPASEPTQNQPIDYQFYDALEKFELPEPTEDTAAQDEGGIPILQNTKDDIEQVAPQNQETNKADKDELPTRYILQAGTFTDAEKAQIQRRKIIDLGHKDAHIFQAVYDGKQYYRVWLGPYPDQEKASIVGSALKAARIEVMLRYDLRNFNPKQE